jgi:hypothetical protein
MADRIANLPTSHGQTSDIDMNIMKDIFGHGTNVATSLNLKKIIIPAIVFVILNLPTIDNLIKNNVTSSESVLLFVKTIVFLIVLVVLQLVSS